jgi:hypothetical protein
VAGLATSLAAALLTGCGGQSAGALVTSLAEGDPTKPYLGMTKAEITACAGMPHSRYDSGDTETFTYQYSGAGPVPGQAAKEKKSKKPEFFGGKKNESGKEWDCTASLVFADDRLVRVSYAHKMVRSPYQWQSEDDEQKKEEMRREGVPTCQFSLPNCRR